MATCIVGEPQPAAAGILGRMTIDTVLLDADGTLLDTREYILRAFDHAQAVSGLPFPPREHLARQVGRMLEDIYDEIAGTEHRAALIEAHRSFQAANQSLVTAFPGTLETMAALRQTGMRLAVVTSRSRRTSVESIRVAGLLAHIEAVVSAEDAEELKPHPAPLEAALRMLGRTHRSAVMVGDTVHDIHAGRALGVPTVGVTYGFGAESIRDAAPDALIDDITELPGALARLAAARA